MKNKKILIGCFALLLLGVWDLGILSMDVNPTKTHILNSILFFTVLPQIKSNNKIIYAIFLLSIMILSYEIIRFIYFPFITPFMVLYMFIYLFIITQSYSQVKKTKTHYDLPYIRILTYFIFGFLSIYIGHYDLYENHFFSHWK